MANVRFRPNKGKKVTDTSIPQKIYLRYRVGNKIDFNASIGFSVKVSDNDSLSDWDNSKQRVKNRSTITNRDEINTLITDLNKHFEDFDNTNKSKGITPSYKQVRDYYESYFTKSENSEDTAKGLFDFIQWFIDESERTNKVTRGTIKNYKLTQTILSLFNAEVYTLDFDNINLDFYNDFIEWCNKKNLSVNYIGKHLRTLKTFLNQAVEDCLTTNVQFRSKRFKIPKEDVDNIYLSMDELTALIDLDLSHEPRHDNIRDLFLIGCFTGLRVSDYNNLTSHSIKTVNGVKMILVKAQKTSKEVAIPLHPVVEKILSKNNGNPPAKIPDQKINEGIKDICESAGIDEIVYITHTKGGKRITVKKYKFELVKTHTARRSFCTNAYLSGMLPIDIMSISGHTTEKSFLTYIKRTPEQTAIKMSQHPFFNGDNVNLKAV